ncbi:hypothetical protein CHS0354_001788 [Potamilus streckersoni]|uniref:Uncharacterized protein n=1 Tax=Potamilus streckersoni TaxID=2493646 RepID=A0AAE0VQD8_9BIVA|nr:hypothetical protein CHS0354_001788 [Potamilus streckersoni]
MAPHAPVVLVLWSTLTAPSLAETTSIDVVIPTQEILKTKIACKENTLTDEIGKKQKEDVRCKDIEWHQVLKEVRLDMNSEGMAFHKEQQREDCQNLLAYHCQNLSWTYLKKVNPHYSKETNTWYNYIKPCSERLKEE